MLLLRRSRRWRWYANALRAMSVTEAAQSRSTSPSRTPYSNQVTSMSVLMCSPTSVRAPTSANTSTQCIALMMLLLATDPCSCGSSHDTRAATMASTLAASSMLQFWNILRTSGQHNLTMYCMLDNEDTDVPGTHNSERSRHGLVICVDVDMARPINLDTEREIAAWLTLGLEDAQAQLAPSATWHYVRGVRYDQWQDEDFWMNGIQVTVHFAPTYDAGFDWPVFHNRSTPHVIVDAADVLRHIREPPAYVRAFGVSAVQQRCLAREWSDTVARESRTFDRPGDGYNMHPMYTLCQGSEITVTAETSDTFGWSNYSGSHGEE